MALTACYQFANPKLLYDGFEDNWVGQPWPLPQADGTTFRAQLNADVLPIKQAAAWLGREDFQQLLRELRVQASDWSGQGDFVYSGYDGLPVYYVRHGQQLWVLSAGEFQPARYKTYLYGCWLVS